jgi:hypothetical protein
MKKLLLLIILIASFVAGCTNRPHGTLSRSKMESVLYDFHLMQGIIDQIPSSERVDKAQDYINAVYQKHGITEAQFDQSIAYYNRNPKDLHQIYRNLKKRYTAQNEEIKLINGNNDMMAVFATGGDTTNLWSSTRLIMLRNKSCRTEKVLQSTLIPHFISTTNSSSPSLPSFSARRRAITRTASA